MRAIRNQVTYYIASFCKVPLFCLHAIASVAAMLLLVACGGGGTATSAAPPSVGSAFVAAPLPPSSLTASKGASSDRVDVVVSVPGQPAVGDSPAILHVSRQGLEIGTATLQPGVALTTTFTDVPPLKGHTYTYIAYVSGPTSSGVFSAELTAPGYSGVADGSFGLALPANSLSVTTGPTAGTATVKVDVPYLPIGCAWTYSISRDAVPIATAPLTNSFTGSTITVTDGSAPAGIHLYSATLSAPGYAFGGPSPCGTSSSVSASGPL